MPLGALAHCNDVRCRSAKECGPQAFLGLSFPLQGLKLPFFLPVVFNVKFTEAPSRDYPGGGFGHCQKGE